MKPKPKFSLITVNYNGADLTLDLIKSLEKSPYTNFDLWVVDNGSKEKMPDFSKDFSFVKVIYSQENLGFAGGNNLALKKAEGDFFIFINNDTEIDPQFLVELDNQIIQNNNNSFGIIACRLMWYDQKDLIQFAGHYGLNPITARGFSRGYKEKDNPKFHNIHKTHLAHGAAMLVTREAVLKVGLMPDIYFLYYEELDFCEKIKRAGFDIIYNGKAVVYHKESMSVGKNSPLKIYYMTRNRLLFIRRNVFGFKFILSYLYHLLIAFPKQLLGFVKNKEFSLIPPFFKGIWWNFTNFNVFKDPTL